MEKDSLVPTVSSPVSQGVVTRRCNSGGFWEKDDNGQVWRDMSQCEEEKEVASQEVNAFSTPRKCQTLCMDVENCHTYQVVCEFLVSSLVIKVYQLWQLNSRVKL